MAELIFTSGCISRGAVRVKCFNTVTQLGLSLNSDHFKQRPANNTSETQIMSCQICCHEFQSLCNYLSTKLVTWLLNSIFCLRFTWTNLCEKQDLIFSSDNELTIYWYSSYLLNFLDLFVNLSRKKILITEAGFLLNSTCLEPPSVEPYKWDSTDITKWPVSIAHLKCLCHLWVLTKFAVGRTCEMIFFKWSWDDEFDDHTHNETFAIMDSVFLNSRFNSNLFPLDMIFSHAL